ncbi:4Fe-4S dicluster domain-containing protein [Clostridium pascui]|uniref:4Fe-4S dicluster domain-containing protein n=1 Tax=Clostridium pascui TaxID=46609 RepID=UPI00311CC4FC
MNSEKCVLCIKCKTVCPMNVDITDNKRNRENGTECILCAECIKICPRSAIKL